MAPGDRIAEALRRTRTSPSTTLAPPVSQRHDVVDGLRRVLPDDLADAVVLHQALHLTCDQIADAIGTDPATVACHLRTAERQLTSCTR